MYSYLNHCYVQELNKTQTNATFLTLTSHSRAEIISFVANASQMGTDSSSSSFFQSNNVIMTSLSLLKVNNDLANFFNFYPVSVTFPLSVFPIYFRWKINEIRVQLMNKKNKTSFCQSKYTLMKEESEPWERGWWLSISLNLVAYLS